MRKGMLLAAVAGLLLGLAGRATAADEPQAVVERAVRAHGGADTIAQLKAVRMKARGTLYLGKESVPFTGETTAQLPDQLKNTLSFELENKKQAMTQVVNGDKAAVNVNGQALALKDQHIAEMREMIYGERVNTLVPLLKEKGFELASAGEGKVDDRPTVAVKVSARGHRDIVLHFDRESGLLVKAERRALDFGTLKEVAQVEQYGDFKDVDGLRRPMKVTVYRDGKKYMEGEVVQLRYFDKLDDDEFKQP